MRLLNACMQQEGYHDYQRTAVQVLGMIHLAPTGTLERPFLKSMRMRR